ncbi:hypothetical protein IAT38_001033 [Cryptococcus sp. DSM 104549]
MADNAGADRRQYVPHRFINEVINKPRAALWGDVNTKHPAISYRYVPGEPDEPFYFTEFKPPLWYDPISDQITGRFFWRLELCKVWTSVTNVATLLQWMKRTLVDAAFGYYGKYYPHLDVWIAQYRGYQQELGLAMEILFNWEAAHNVPRSWENIIGNNTYLLGNNPNRLIPPPTTTTTTAITPSPSTASATHTPISTAVTTATRTYRRTLTPLFLFTAIDAKQAIANLRRDNRILDMMGGAVPDCEYYCFPPGFPIRNEEIRPLDVTDRGRTVQL